MKRFLLIRASLAVLVLTYLLAANFIFRPGTNTTVLIIINAVFLLFLVLDTSIKVRKYRIAEQHVEDESDRSNHDLAAMLQQSGYKKEEIPGLVQTIETRERSWLESQKIDLERKNREQEEIAKRNAAKRAALVHKLARKSFIDDSGQVNESAADRLNAAERAEIVKRVEKRGPRSSALRLSDESKHSARAATPPRSPHVSGIPFIGLATTGGLLTFFVAKSVEPAISSVAVFATGFSASLLVVSVLAGISSLKSAK